MKLQAMKKTLYGRLCLGVVLVALLAACATPPPPEAPPTATESQPPAPLPPSPPPPPSPAGLPAPLPTEVSAAVEHIYKDTVRMSASRAPGFVVGDFNGDKAQDLAVIVEPVKEKIDELNSEVAAWLIRDPVSASLPPPVMAVNHNEPPARPLITAADAVLLVIIHGYGAQGWRNTEAQQTYLLKNTVPGTLAVAPRRQALAAVKNTAVPPVRGDCIKATLAEAAGFLYYNGSSYAWYDPRTYRGEGATRMAH